MGLQDWLQNILNQQAQASGGKKVSTGDISQFSDPSKYLGSNFNWLTQQFKSDAQSGSKFVEQMIKEGKRGIGMQSRRAMEDIATAGAQSGFRGANANLINNLFETETKQIGQLEVQGAQMNEAVRAQSLASLMGLNQFEGQTKMQTDTQRESVRQYEQTFQENVRQFGLQYALEKRKVDLQEEAQSGSFWDFAGNALGLAGGIFTGNWLSSLLG